MAGRGSGNSRNGSYPKTVTTEIGPVELRVPRDRNATFDPVTVPKGQRRLDGLIGQRDLALRQGDDHRRHPSPPAEIYGTEISRDTITRITDAVVEDMVAWQNRPLDRVYPVMLIDAIVVKIRDGQVANRPIYVASGSTWTANATCWGCGSAHRRGRREVLDDGAHRAPQPRRGRCVHRVLRRAERPAGVDPGDLAADRRAAVRRAPGALTACATPPRRTGGRWPGDPRDLHRPDRRGRRGPLAEFADTWDERYPAMVDTWQQAWEEFVPFLAFPVEIRTVVYTTNAIETLNARFRKAVRHRGHFPTEQAALKVLYLVATERRPNRSNPTGKDQRLEDHPQRPDHPLRRPHRGRQLTMTSRPVTQTIGQSRGRAISLPAITQPAMGGEWVGGVGDKGGNGVGGVTVEDEELSGRVVAHRGRRVGVAGRLLRPVGHTQLLNSLSRPPSVASSDWE